MYPLKLITVALNKLLEDNGHTGAFLPYLELRIMDSELSEVRQKSAQFHKEHERFVETRMQITLDNCIARNRGPTQQLWGKYSMMFL
jgi:hypothetical protein